MTEMPSLRAELAAIAAGSKSRLPAEAIAAMAAGTQTLRDSGLAGRALKVGQVAPNFTLADDGGEIVSLERLLARGPVVVTFYRGVWCPYCNADLKALQRALPRFAQAGASLVSISPQNASNSRKAKRDNGLDFPILSDPGNEVAAHYGLRFTLEPQVKVLYRDRFGIDLERFNGDASWTLPMPARFVIARDGVVAYAEVDPDYTTRPDPSELLPALAALAQAA
jgi:peroxiredoxin